MRTKNTTTSSCFAPVRDRSLAILAVLLFMLPATFAQTTVQVGSGSNNSNFVPVRTGQNFSYSQMIYYPVNVGNAGVIKTIRFWFTSGTDLSNSNNWGIYMGHTSQNTFTTNASSFIPLSQLTLVYDGAVSYPSAGNWLEVTLTTPFDYSGSQNLVIAVDENTPGASTLSWGVFSASPSNRVIGGQSTTDIDPASPIRSFNDNSLPRLELVFAPLTDVTLEMRTPDGTSDQISWELLKSSNNEEVCSGGGYPAAITDPITAFCSLVEGCYRLRVSDSFGDGFGVGGGYQLRLSGSETTDVRIIDNLGNFSSGSLSALAGGPADICFPMATGPKPLLQHRDKLDFVSGQFLVSEEDAAVSAEWIPNGPNNVQSTNTGYEFWLFDPNGSYSFRRFRNHATSDNFGNVGATRACHMKINNWSVAQHAPSNMLLNVRIRTRVNGVNENWAPAYRFKIDPVRAACPLTQLNDTPDNVALSCNQTRVWGNGNWIHARPISGANKYQFRFRIASEGFNRVITSNTYFVQLNWATQPLLAGKTYTVDVRASKDGGATWCTAAIPPALTAEWGVMCSLSIIASNAQGGSQNLTLGNDDSSLTMYPNPNQGDQLFLSIDAIDANVGTVSLDIYDLTGQRTIARTIPTQDGQINSQLDLNGLAAGVYIVHITAGEKVYTERLVVTQ